MIKSKIYVRDIIHYILKMISISALLNLLRINYKNYLQNDYLCN